MRQRLVYENRYVWVYDDDVRFPNGEEGQYFRCRWKAPHGVAVAPVLNGRVLLVQLHRYGDSSASFEIPKGFGTDPVSVEDDARRELTEETGCEAADLTQIAEVGGDFRTYVFRAGLKQNSVPNSSGSEATEDIVGFQWLEIEEIATSKFKELGIHDELTMMVLLHLKLTE